MNKNIIVISIAIIVGCLIIGGFYYKSELNKQESIERQLEVKLENERRIEEEKVAKDKEVALIKESCVKEAEQSAMNLYKDYCMSSSYCDYEEGMYMIPQYENGYKICLQRHGLE